VDDRERDVAVAAEAVAGDWRQSPVASHWLVVVAFDLSR
jgi:hypothetical protein